MATFTVIGDDTPERDLQPPPGYTLALDLSTRPEGFGAYAGLAEPFPRELLIPRADWQGIIEEKKARGTRTVDRMKQERIPAKDQKSTNYCWFFGPVQCLEVVRVCKMGLPYVSLSPASGAAPMTGYRNVGGWGRRALERIVEKGVCPSSMWPDTAIERRYDTVETRAAALDYRVTEWWELSTLDEYISALLRGFPVAAGYNWWRHETMTVDADWLDGEIATLDRNQWRGYGDDNYFHLQGRRMLPDDMVVPRVAIAS